MPCIYNIYLVLEEKLFLCGEVLHLCLLFVGEELSEQAKEEKVMRSPAVTTIKEMGYSEDRIKVAIFTLKQRLPKGRCLSGGGIVCLITLATFLYMYIDILSVVLNK